MNKTGFPPNLKNVRPKNRLSLSGHGDSTEDSNRISNGPNIYQIGAELGRGGFAVVYAAFNVETGDFVAVKRFPLDAIDDEYLNKIEDEIETMQKLNHPNIVKYIDTIKTKSFLHIVLEYMENGSLSNVIKKFGSFSESLTAIYITQVLRGLKYLHEQGVLHRDIKGANILTTKEGMVKLADFGVAMKLSEAHAADQDVVGSPYWIAPEIIEMSRPTTACDIWSVGCIIIELLTGKPPYYDLAPMTALFRIVQDDYPPLPEGISPALRDFLLLCFKKEPLMRSSATKLLEHPWLNNSSTASNLVNTSRMLQSKSTVGNDCDEDGSKNIDREADSIVNTIKLYQNEVETLQQCEETSMNTLINRSLSNVGQSLELFKLPNKDPNNVSNRSTSSIITNNNTISPTKQIIPEKLLSKKESKLSIQSIENQDSDCNLQSKSSTPDFSDSSAETSDNMVPNRIIFSANLLDLPVVKNQSIKFSNAPFVYNENNNNNNSFKQDDEDDDEIWDDEIIQDERIISASLDELDDEYAINISKTGTKTNNRSTNKLESLSSSFRSPDKSVKSSKNYALAPHNMTQKISPSGMKSISLDSFSSSFYAKNKNLSLGVRSPKYFSSMLSIRTSTKDSAESIGSVKNVLNMQHSSFLLSKYQESPDDDDFDDLFVQPTDITNNKPSYSDDRNVEDNVRVFHSVSSEPVAFKKVDISKSIQHVLSGNSLDKSNSLDKFESEDFSDDFEIDSPMEFNKKLKHFKNLSSDQNIQDIKNNSQNISKYAKLTLNRYASNNDADGDDGFEGEGNVFDPDVLAVKLRERMKNSTNNTVEEFDSFINYQFDEKDFKQNEHKDVHIRRSKEVVEIMAKIRPETKEKVVIELCDLLMSIFNQYPEQRDHLITYHGVMPIIDMFEARTSAETKTMGGRGPGIKIVRPYVLRVINKIIEGSIRAQEQISLVGLIPTIMNLFERSCRNHKITTYNNTTPFSVIGSSSNDRSPFKSSSDSIDQPKLHEYHAHSPVYQAPLIVGEVDPVTIETARFIHQISSTSSLTLQMLIGAGGLTVLTSMVSFGAHIIPRASSNNNPGKSNLPQIGSPYREKSLSTNNLYSPNFSKSSDNGCNINPMSPNIKILSNNINEDTSMQNKKDNRHLEIASLEIPPDGDPNSCMTIFQMGIDCITQVFAIQSSRTRDFCRLFVRLGLLGHLSVSFRNIISLYIVQINKIGVNYIHENNNTNRFHVRNNSGSSMSTNIVDNINSYNNHHDSDDCPERKYSNLIATLFFKFSRSDAIVAETMVSHDTGVISVIIEVLSSPDLRSQEVSQLNLNETLSPNNSLSLANLAMHNLMDNKKKPMGLLPAYVEIIELLLKCIKNLSMEPKILDDLEKAGTIEILIPLLSGPISERCKNHVLPCLFNMCRINRRRQELAAMLGIVPHLKKVITDGSHLRQFALPIIFDLAHASNITRSELWKYDCVSFYVELLKENYWQRFALNSLATWMSYDVNNVSILLVESSKLLKLTEFFHLASAQTIHTIHEPLLDMMHTSKELSKSLSCSKTYISALVRRLNSTKEAIVLRSLLKMLQFIYHNHENPKKLVSEYNLLELVKEFASSEGQILVCNTAKRLLRDFENLNST